MLHIFTCTENCISAVLYDLRGIEWFSLSGVIQIIHVLPFSSNEMVGHIKYMVLCIPMAWHSSAVSVCTILRYCRKCMRNCIQLRHIQNTQRLGWYRNATALHARINIKCSQQNTIHFLLCSLAHNCPCKCRECIFRSIDSPRFGIRNKNQQQQQQQPCCFSFTSVWFFRNPQTG